MDKTGEKGILSVKLDGPEGEELAADVRKVVFPNRENPFWTIEFENGESAFTTGNVYVKVGPKKEGMIELDPRVDELLKKMRLSENSKKRP